MELSLLLTLLFFLFIDLHAQKFEEESPFMPIRLMDVKIFEWKPDSLQKMERALDSELKYTDEKKGTACKTIRFEQEAGYPKQDARFLDLSVRGICTTEEGKDVPIEKDLITKAIIQKKEAVNAAVHGHVFSSGNVRFYERDRNKLNLIIIPSSVGFVTLLFILTFFLRRMRAHQKREHIISELQKKRELTQKKTQNLTMTMPNIDPFANDKQRLLQLDPTVVGNVSHTTGSSKQFTNEQYVSRKSNHVPPVTTATTMNDQRTYNRTQQQQHDDDDVPPPIPPKDNRAPYYKREEENPFASQRPVKTSHERMYVPFENDTRYSPTHGQHHDMMPLQEKQPRVIVRSIRDDENYPPFYQQQTNFDDSTPTFVSIPVQIEHSGSHQRFSSPYHSDPYYPHINS